MLSVKFEEVVKMFNIYETRSDRDLFLNKLKEMDPCVALVIAFLDFEWTVRRCILALGLSSTKNIREKFSGELPINFFDEDNNSDEEKNGLKGHFICGLDGYNKLWTKEDGPKQKIYFYDLLKSRVDISKIKDFDPNKLYPLNLEKSDLEHTDNFLKFVYERFRNTLIHGSRSRVQEDTAIFVFNFITACSRALSSYAEEQGKPIYGKKIIRRSRRVERDS